MTEKAKRQKKDTGEADPSFEQALSRLEEITHLLESGELPLEGTIALAEEALKLAELCEKQLGQAEGKIERLVERSGTIGLEPVETGAEEEEE